MRQCWLSIPDDRPEFSDCRRRIGRELARCSSDYYRELLNALKLYDDAKSESTPPPVPVACQRFNSSHSDDYETEETSDSHENPKTISDDPADAAMNLSYFDCPPSPKAEGMEMVPLTGPLDQDEP